MMRALMAVLILGVAGIAQAVEPIPATGITIQEDVYNPCYFALSWSDPNRDAYFDIERFDGSGWARATFYPMLQCTYNGNMQAGVYRIRSQSIFDEFDVSYSQPIWIPFEVIWYP